MAEKQTKYIFVTGGVVSGLGKGITAASLGRLLKCRGLKVASQKLDPYVNVDPGCAVQRPPSGGASCGCCRPCSAWPHSTRMPTCSWPFTGACSPFPRTGTKNFWTR